MFGELENYQVEPPLLPVTDFVVENVENYQDLNPDAELLRNQAFLDQLKKALENAGKFESGKIIHAGYYEVHLGVKIDGKPVGFVIKIPTKKEVPQAGAVEQYEIFREYCPTITLPTIFLNVSFEGGQTELISLQREITDGLNIENYLSQLFDDEEMSAAVRAGAYELVDGLERLYEIKKLMVEPRTISPYHDNVMVDPNKELLWLVDTNYLTESNNRDREMYKRELTSFRKYIAEH